jgi:hypothetical protein
MQRESYWDYMGRRMKEERINDTKDSLEKRIEELERKVSLLDGSPRQLELEV